MEFKISEMTGVVGAGTTDYGDKPPVVGAGLSKKKKKKKIIKRVKPDLLSGIDKKKVKESRELSPEEVEDIQMYFFNLGIKCYINLTKNYIPKDYKELLEYVDMESRPLSVSEIYSIIYKSGIDFPEGYDEVYSKEIKLERHEPGESLDFFLEGFNVKRK